MEFFERAHVKRNSKKKDTKSDANMKKQLKQMLHGYKENDNKLIKTCVRCKSDICDPQNCFDDSSSVSGFSDLNITNSSSEANITTSGTIHSQSDVDFSKEMENDKEQCIRILKEEDASSKSISELSNEAESVDSQDESDNLISSDEIYINQSSISDDYSSELKSTTNESNASIPSSLDQSTAESTESGPHEFDSDGKLASKILKNLGKKLKPVKTKKETKKKILKNVKQYTSDTESDRKCNQRKSKNTDKSIKSCKNNKFGFVVESNLKKESDEDLDELERSSSDNSVTSDSQYISITATNIQNENLSEILGEYRYPTIKNIQIEKHQIVHSNSGIFETEDMNVEDVELEEVEEVSSIVPELDDTPKVQDLEIDMENSITEPMDESPAINDDSYISELNEESSQDIINIVESVNSVNVYPCINSCILVLKHPTKLYIHGKVNIKALAGTLEVFGYTLKDNWCPLYAPNNSFAQHVKTVAAVNAFHGLFSKLTAMGLSVADAEEISTTLDEYNGVLALSPLEDRKMDFVDTNFTIRNMFGKKHVVIEESLKAASELLGCALYTDRPFRILETQPVWDDVVTCGLEACSRAVICGAKGTGKSTFLKYYVNKLLANGPVLVIDLDPGQAEFTVAGNVSATVVEKPLLGLNFTHLMTPDRMLNIGMISTMDNPTLYVDAVNSLITYCKSQERFRTMPWVVNTMGMCNNIGLKFITLTILKTEPTLLLQIDSKESKRRFDTTLDAESIMRLYYTDFQYNYLFKNIRVTENLEYNFFMTGPYKSEKRASSIQPKEERYLNFLAYFGELLNIYNTNNFLEIVPYEVNIKDLNIVTNVNIAEDSIAKVINGKVVALCRKGGDKRTVAVQEESLLCVGHGLIRGVDFEKGVLYVLSPTPAAAFCEVDTIAYGDWVPELRGQERLLPSGVAVPYCAATHHGQRQLIDAPRRRFNPLQLLKASRSS